MEGRRTLILSQSGEYLQLTYSHSINIDTRHKYVYVFLTIETYESGSTN